MKNFFTNWKTTSFGILAIVGGIVALVFAPAITAPIIMGSATSIVTGVGLIFAKDGDVTGGTKPATPEAETRVQ